MLAVRGNHSIAAGIPAMDPIGELCIRRGNQMAEGSRKPTAYLSSSVVGGGISWYWVLSSSGRNEASIQAGVTRVKATSRRR